MVAHCGDTLVLVVNAANKVADEAYLRAHLTVICEIAVLPRALLALQGPGAETALARLARRVAAMRFMDVRTIELAGTSALVTRSGYTGEDGFEISVPRTGPKAGRSPAGRRECSPRRPRRPRFPAPRSRPVPAWGGHRCRHRSRRGRPRLVDSRRAPPGRGAGGWVSGRSGDPRGPRRRAPPAGASACARRAPHPCAGCPPVRRRGGGGRHRPDHLGRIRAEPAGARRHGLPARGADGARHRVFAEVRGRRSADGGERPALRAGRLQSAPEPAPSLSRPSQPDSQERSMLRFTTSTNGWPARATSPRWASPLTRPSNSATSSSSSCRRSAPAS